MDRPNNIDLRRSPLVVTELTLFDNPPKASQPAHLIRVLGRTFRTSPVFDSYWEFAALRQAIYMARLHGTPPPWTGDEILQSFRFTNIFRATDRVSQFLLRHVILDAGSPKAPQDIVFRVLLFKIFNREDTWRHLESQVGTISWTTYDYEQYCRALDEAIATRPIYSPAYLMPSPKFGEKRKHGNHLRLVELMMRNGAVNQICESGSLRETYETILRFPSIGPFLAFQYAIDLNYSDIIDFDEDDFVIAGPGAKDGIRKCFGRQSEGIEDDLIRYMVDSQESHFQRLGLPRPDLFGRRLHLIDCQNLFCEVDKYARVRHPEVAGISGRHRIKQRFRPAGPVPAPVFPHSWHLTVGLLGQPK
jgi:hypothetical protein